MYNIDGRDVLFAWLERERDPNRRQAMLDWLTMWANDPIEHAHRIPGRRAPIYLVETGVAGVTLTFLHAEQYRTVRLLEFGRMP